MTPQVARRGLSAVLRRVPVDEHACRIAPNEGVNRHPLARVHELDLWVVGEPDRRDRAGGIVCQPALLRPRSASRGMPSRRRTRASAVAPPRSTGPARARAAASKRAHRMDPPAHRAAPQGFPWGLQRVTWCGGAATPRRDARGPAPAPAGDARTQRRGRAVRAAYRRGNSGAVGWDSAARCVLVRTRRRYRSRGARGAACDWTSCGVPFTGVTTA
jgi:hypothetical protein